MDDIDTLLTRGVDAVYPSRSAMETLLRSGKKITLYQGFDPTGTTLHIGHAVGFRKLRQFQDLGHHVIFLVGDGTGQAGDPSGKSKTREKFFTREELRENGKNYLLQAAKIVRFDGDNPVKILYNGDWLNDLKLVDILNIAQHFSVQQLIERDMFQDRIKKGESINLREFLYPLLQGYDSVAMGVDLEIGGSDQTFNMLCGRTLVKAFQNREKFVLTTPLLVDAQGRKIGKTEGNVIGLTDPPSEFYAKIMALSDDAIVPCFMLLTDTSLEKINEMGEHMNAGQNPMDFKKQLAFELTKQLHDDTAALSAAKEFNLRSSGNLTNASLPTMALTAITSGTLLDVLMQTNLAPSKSEARRLVDQKAIELNDNVMTDTNTILTLKSGDILKVGKKKYLKFI